MFTRESYFKRLVFIQINHQSRSRSIFPSKTCWDFCTSINEPSGQLRNISLVIFLKRKVAKYWQMLSQLRIIYRNFVSFVKEGDLHWANGHQCWVRDSQMRWNSVSNDIPDLIKVDLYMITSSVVAWQKPPHFAYFDDQYYVNI